MRSETVHGIACGGARDVLIMASDLFGRMADDFTDDPGVNPELHQHRCRRVSSPVRRGRRWGARFLFAKGLCLFLGDYARGEKKVAPLGTVGAWGDG